MHTEEVGKIMSKLTPVIYHGVTQVELQVLFRWTQTLDALKVALQKIDALSEKMKMIEEFTTQNIG